ncbi:MAG: 3-hydroxybutyryl-CoA dehydrogenase [Proteobacteria bacterium]|nr:3-hydroxybutyryl-CoA dehydrogenase [Pseudomonadota bacterium]
MIIEKVAVLGAGTMGHGIAHVCAMAGYQVHLFDISEDSTQKGLNKIKNNLEKGIARGKLTEQQKQNTLKMLTGTSSLETACTDANLVIEAIPEIPELKQDLLSKVESLISSESIIGSNTSSISIETLADCLKIPQRFIGTHFFNPVHIMKLLELVHHPKTSDITIDALKNFSLKINKEAILVKNSPGFATSRLGVALGMEAIRMLEENVASAEDIDKAMVLGYRHPMGPLKLTDLVGLDVRKNIGEYLAQELKNPAFSPPKLMLKLVNQGSLGQKTGQGFYTW